MNKHVSGVAGWPLHTLHRWLDYSGTDTFNLYIT